MCWKPASSILLVFYWAGCVYCKPCRPVASAAIHGRKGGSWLPILDLDYWSSYPTTSIL